MSLNTKLLFLAALLVILLTACGTVSSAEFPGPESAVTAMLAPAPTATVTRVAAPTIAPTAVIQALPLLPSIASYSEQNGELPDSLTWVLKTELPQTETAVPVLRQPVGVEPKTAEEAVAFAKSYGFNEQVYVEARPGLPPEEAAAMGLFVVFDGPRTLSMASAPYWYSDASRGRQILEMPFAEAALIAEQFLLDNGWLSFPYAIGESSQGEGVLFLPIIDGVKLLSPAYGVLVADDGQISSMSIYSLETITAGESYPIITAETAWADLPRTLNQTGTFYRLEPPAPETSAVNLYPIEYNNTPSAGQQGDVYTNIWVYRPLAGDGPPVIQSTDFFRIKGDVAMLNEMAEEADYLLHLWGTVRELDNGQRELELSDWQVIKDAGGLPTFFGTIKEEDQEMILVDEANQTDYLIFDAPAELARGDYVAVSGMPEIDGDVSQLRWQKITFYAPQPEEEPRPTDIPIKTITIDSAKLVYLPQPAYFSGLADNLFIPTWEFSGMADNGTKVTLWRTAVVPAYFTN